MPPIWTAESGRLERPHFVVGCCFKTTSMQFARDNPVVRATVVLSLTILMLTLSALLLPPKGSNAMPRDNTSYPVLSSRN